MGCHHVILPIDELIFFKMVETTKLTRSHDGFRITHVSFFGSLAPYLVLVLSIGAGFRRFGEDLQADDSAAPDRYGRLSGNMWKHHGSNARNSRLGDIFCRWLGRGSDLVGSSSFIIVIGLGILVGGLEHECYDFPYIGKNHPNCQLTIIFQRCWNHRPGINVCYSPTMLSSNDYATRILTTRAAHALAFQPRTSQWLSLSMGKNGDAPLWTT